MKRQNDLTTLCAYLDQRLAVAEFPGDHSNNGLQVEGQPTVERVAVGVDAGVALFEAAVAARAELIIVHHGLSWGSEPRRLTGWIARRYGLLMRHGISLYACHLPLDAHPELGNNAQLADRIGLIDREAFFEYDGRAIGWRGRLPEACTPAALAECYRTTLPSAPRWYGLVAPERPVRQVAIVSGGGGLGALTAAAQAGAELLVTGEMEHVMYHAAIELGVPVLALGHYASETVGVRAVWAELREKFQLDGGFVDLPTNL